MTVELHEGACVEVMRGMADASVDSIVTDPPYGLRFMGKKWDGRTPAVDTFIECLRVLKPGGHLLAFSGARTYHRLAVAVEDAGFEIRDQIMWIYGSGFPKSQNVSKAIDKAAGAKRESTGRIKPGHEGFANRGNMSSVQSFKGTMGGDGGFSRPWMDDPEKVEAYHQETAPATEAAKQWDGWGTALKPSSEPLVFAQKPSPDTDLAGKIGSKLNVLESELWSMLSANIAVEHFGLSPSEYDAACAGAQWTADEKRSTWAALCAQMDTSQFVSVVSTSLSIVQSWRNTLAALWKDPSTFITGTESSTTIDWKTLKSCASTITPRTIIQAAMSPDGWTANAGPAERYFNAELLRLSAILELSAHAIATGNPHIDYPVEGASPQHRPIVMARKPLDGTVSENVLRHGTGAINVDGCRVPGEGGQAREGEASQETRYTERGGTNIAALPGPRGGDPAGRWPANVIHDGSDEVLEGFPHTKTGTVASHSTKGMWGSGADTSYQDIDPGGSAARFFYCAKASRKDRNEGCEALDERPLNWSSGTQNPGSFQAEGTHKAARNYHPTVKPTELMRYLCRLVTPPGGIVLDPLMGSGSTGKAAVLEGFGFIGIELPEDEDGFGIEIARARIDHALRERLRQTVQPGLFPDEAHLTD